VRDLVVWIAVVLEAGQPGNNENEYDKVVLLLVAYVSADFRKCVERNVENSLIN